MLRNLPKWYQKTQYYCYGDTWETLISLIVCTHMCILLLCIGSKTQQTKRKTRQHCTLGMEERDTTCSCFLKRLRSHRPIIYRIPPLYSLFFFSAIWWLANFHSSLSFFYWLFKLRGGEEEEDDRRTREEKKREETGVLSVIPARRPAPAGGAG